MIKLISSKAPSHTTTAPLSKQMPEAIEISSSDLLETSVQLLRHLNPRETEKNLNLLGEALPELKEALRGIVDIPSKVIVASEANNREFLSFELEKCTGDGCKNCYRCPWDNKFYSIIDGKVCCDALSCTSKQENENLKKLEGTLNEAVRTYASLYYGTDAITSVYVQEQSDTSKESESKGCFLVAILIKKNVEMEDDENNFSSTAVWDSVHLFEIESELENDETNENEEFVYRHTATVMLSFNNSVENLKNIRLVGNIINQNEVKVSLGKAKDYTNHIMHLGSLLEESESRLRNDLQSIYFGRTHDIVNELRSAVPDGFLRNQSDLREEMMSRLGRNQQ